nr:hypothetical protein [Tanacetum cinerariifolium]
MVAGVSGGCSGSRGGVGGQMVGCGVVGGGGSGGLSAAKPPSWWRSDDGTATIAAPCGVGLVVVFPPNC